MRLLQITSLLRLGGDELRPEESFLLEWPIILASDGVELMIMILCVVCGDLFRSPFCTR